MILILAGASGTARELIVDAFLGDHPDWKHLALEDVIEDDAVDENDGPDMEQVFATVLACETAKDEAEQGHHIITTLPSPYLIETVLDQFEEAATAFLGKVPTDLADMFEHTIDGSQSVPDTCGALEDVIAEYEE